ncbi:MAG: HD domain-containing phosphohydrolase [Planctomycetota bacterium]
MSDAASASASLDISALKVGQRLTDNLCDDRGRLLLASGTLITEHFLEVLRSRGIRKVQTQGPSKAQPTDPSAGTESRKSPASGSATPKAQSLDTEGSTNAEAYALTDRPRPPKARLDQDKFEQASQQALEHAERLLDSWEDQGHAWIETTRKSQDTRKLDAGPTTDLLQDVLPVIAMDVDLAAVMVGLGKSARQPILTHGVRTALVAMHLAQQVGYPERRVIDAGVTGLLADLGMARLPEQTLRAERSLTPNEWLDVRRHPAYSADLLEHAGIAKDIRIAIYQHHERLDGSGYPHGRKGFFLHPLARLIAVADTYAALSEPRHHRPAQSTHHAVKAVLLGVKAGQLDPTVGKLLVDTVGLFPVGLRVDVGECDAVDSKPTIASQVLRSPDAHPDRPILAVLDEEGEPTKKRIDLSVRDELVVTKVYAPHERPGVAANAA